MAATSIACVVGDRVPLIEPLHQLREHAVRRLQHQVIVRRHQAEAQAPAVAGLDVHAKTGLEACEVVLISKEPLVRKRASRDVVEAGDVRARLARHRSTIAALRSGRKMTPAATPRCLAPLGLRPN